MSKNIQIKDCSECPFLRRDPDCLEEICTLGNITERYGFILEKDGFPLCCPLRKTNVFISM